MIHMFILIFEETYYIVNTNLNFEVSMKMFYSKVGACFHFLNNYCVILFVCFTELCFSELYKHIVDICNVHRASNAYSDSNPQSFFLQYNINTCGYHI